MDSDLPKILIGCPTSSAKDYAFLEWLMHIRQIDYPKEKLGIMMADNSKENSYEKYLQSWGIKTRRIHPGNRNPIEFICDSHNAVREYFLDNDYDYLLHLESDVMIKTQTLRTLLLHSKLYNLPVVNASYFINNNESTVPIIQRMHHRVAQALKFRECMNYSNKLVNIYNCGLGCSLIRKDILKGIKFRYDSDEQIHPDSFFYQDLYVNNIISYLDTSIILKHNSKDWSYNLDFNLIKLNKTK